MKKQQCKFVSRTDRMSAGIEAFIEEVTARVAEAVAEASRPKLFDAKPPKKVVKATPKSRPAAKKVK